MTPPLIGYITATLLSFHVTTGTIFMYVRIWREGWKWHDWIVAAGWAWLTWCIIKAVWRP